MLRTFTFLCVTLAISFSCETARAQPGHGGHGHGGHGHGDRGHGGGSYSWGHGHGHGGGHGYGGPGLSINLGWNSAYLPGFNSYYGPQYYGPNPYYGPSAYPVYAPVPAIGFHGYIPGVPSYSSSSYYEQQRFGPQLLNGPLAPIPSTLAAPGLNQPSIVTPSLSLPQSSPAAQVEALHFMAQGDVQLRTMNFLAAADRYRNAIQAARDLAEPRYRFALTRMGRSQFAEAVDEFKLAFNLKPDWINESPSLDDLFGADNLLAKTQLKQRVADWLLQDGRDPNRLFLLGVLLRMDGDDRSQILIETAIKVAGPQQHLIAVLDNSNPLPAANPLPTANPAGMQEFAPPVTLPNINENEPPATLPTINENEPQPELANPPANPAPNLRGPTLQGPTLPGVK